MEMVVVVEIAWGGGGGRWEGGLTQFWGAVRWGGCISVVVANGAGMSVGGGSVGNRVKWLVKGVAAGSL